MRTKKNNTTRVLKVTQEEFLEIFEASVFNGIPYSRGLCMTFEFLNLHKEFKKHWKKIDTKKFLYIPDYFENCPSIEEAYFLRCLVAIEFLRSIDMLEE